MGQEIVYCFKCQKRIVGADYAKGLAFELENNSCCSACAVLVLDSLPPKAKEQLLGKMFKATQDHLPPPSGGSPAAGGARPSTRRTPGPSGVSAGPRRPLAVPASTVAVGGIVGGALVVGAILFVVFLPSKQSVPLNPPRSESARPASLPAPPSPPSVSPEEERREALAKDALGKARTFAISHPQDFEGQARELEAALVQVERTGYERDVRRDLEKAKARTQEACVQEIDALSRDVRKWTDRKEFKAALEALTRDQSRHASPEWITGVQRLGDEVRKSASSALMELKQKAVQAQERGAPGELAAAKAEVARWGMPELVQELEAALLPAWRPLFDGRTLDGFPSLIASAWRVENGALVHDNAVDNAAKIVKPYGDGDLRFRFEVQGAHKLSFTFGLEGQNRGQVVLFGQDEIKPLEGGLRELIIFCRGDASTAAIDGKPVHLQIHGHPRTGVIQFNSNGGCIRIKSIDFREAK